MVSVDDNATLADRGIVTGKIFEPIGLGTPVLVIAPPGSDVNAVVRTVGRGVVFSASDADGMTAFLLDVIRGKGPESRHPDAYAWSNLIRRFDAMFRQLETGGSDGKN